MLRSNRLLARTQWIGAAIAALAIGACSQPSPETAVAQTAPASQANNLGGPDDVPKFTLDPSWPKRLPNNWVLGHVVGLYAEKNDHIWATHRPGSTSNPGDRYALEGWGECCIPAPPIIEFDAEGTVVQAWGPVHSTPTDNDRNNVPLLKGPGLPTQTWNEKVQWPGQEHGVSVDEKNNTVWVVGWMDPSQVLKFTRDGKFLLRIGQAQAKSVTDPIRENMAGPTQAWPDPDTNEVYVADGYHNRRVAVFDMTTGKLKREWGAYGNKPAGNLGGLPVEENHPPQPYPIYPQRHSPPPADFKDDPATRSKQFATVHCVTMSRDKIVYVCDRINNRVQAFKSDGTYLMEQVVAPRTRGWGAAHGMTLSSDPQQKWVYIADGGNHTVWILRRSDLKVLGRLGDGGRQAGEFGVAHSLAVDSKNNLYVAETSSHNRVQKFTFAGTHAGNAAQTD
jgi:hypothetical protein